MANRGPIQLDIGIVVSSVGGNSSERKDHFSGLFSFFGVDFGLYIGPSYNLFETIGPSIGAGLLIGHNGFLAGKIGIHFKRTLGLAVLFPIVPIYGVAGASYLSAIPIPEVAKSAAAVPLLLVPAAFAYQKELRELRISGTKHLKNLRSNASEKLDSIKCWMQ
jgi:hypothetical protein